MKEGWPIALVNGDDGELTKRLVAELVRREINVVVVAEVPPYFEERVEYEYRLTIEAVEEKIAYVFDFEGQEEVWRRAMVDGAKLTVVEINQGGGVESGKDFLEKLGVNWRIVELAGVYGPGIEGDYFWLKAVERAVKNKNLELPPADWKLRLLAVDDGVEAILRASFLSGTSGETFRVWGEEVLIEEMAKALIDEAKMTKYQVEEKEMEVGELFKVEEDRARESWNKLRWKPKVSFGEGIRETLQYYFMRADEEIRAPKKEKVEARKEKREVIKEEKEIGRQRLEIVGEQKVEVAEKKEKEEFKIEPFWMPKEEEKEEKKEKTEKIEIKEEKREIKNEKRKEKGKLVIAGIMGLVFAGILFGVIAGVRIYKTGMKAKEVMGLIAEKKYDEAKKVSLKSKKTMENWDEKITSGGWNRWGIVRAGQQIIKVGVEAFDLEAEVVDLAVIGEKVSEGIFKDKEIDWKKDLPSLDDEMMTVSTKIGRLMARLSGDWGWLPGRFRAWPQRGYARLAEEKVNLDKMVGMMKIMPEFLGTDGKRREYMVLFQNEMEIRPTGGFIGSYAILSFEGGKLQNLDVRDVYEADGQLKGHVEPPEEIKNYLGEAGWYLRDANWKVNFNLAATDIQWFLEKETGRKVDGVIGIDLAVVKKILEVIGEVYVPDFKEKIGKNNLFEQAEFYSENKFFAGSNQKASFLGGLATQLFEEIRNLKPEKRLGLARGVLELLESNDIQIALNNKQAAAVIGGLGWDGAIYEGKCAVERCVADYFYAVEANLGVNKANYFVYREVEQLVEIAQRSVTRVVRINYENTARNTAQPGGDYKNYLRIYVPAEVNLAEVTVDRRVLGGSEIRVKQVGNKKEIGLWLVVPVAKKMTVELKYSTPVDLTGKDKFSYLHYIQRQPGIGDVGMKVLVSFPSEWKPLQVEPTASMSEGKLLFNEKLTKDLKVGVEIGK